MTIHKTVDPKSGFNSASKTFHSLKPSFNLPPSHAAVSVAEYALSLRRSSPWSDSVAFIDSVTREKFSFSDFVYQTETLAINLRSRIGLSKGDTALVLSPNLVKVPILYFALLTLGVVVSPANPISTHSEISHIIELCKPVITFATSSTVEKLPTLRFRTVLIDSPEFDSLMKKRAMQALPRIEVSQSDLAAILYSSGTTGKVKGVMLTHRNLTASAASYYATTSQRKNPAVFLHTMPYFHVYGFTYCLRSVALSETVVIMEKFSFERMLSAVEEFKVTHIAVVPPLVVAMIKGGVTDGYDLSSLEGMSCGAAPLGKDVFSAFKLKFPKVTLVQVCFM